MQLIPVHATHYVHRLPIAKHAAVLNPVPVRAVLQMEPVRTAVQHKHIPIHVPAIIQAAVVHLRARHVRDVLRGHAPAPVPALAEQSALHAMRGITCPMAHASSAVREHILPQGQHHALHAVQVNTVPLARPVVKHVQLAIEMGQRQHRNLHVSVHLQKQVRRLRVHNLQIAHPTHVARAVREHARTIKIMPAQLPKIVPQQIVHNLSHPYHAKQTIMHLV